jgi:hypothetical protein
MVAVAGTYQNGSIKLDKEYSSKKTVKVIVTFLEEEEEKTASEKGFSFADFSFAKSQEVLKNYSGSLSDALIEERRSEI